MGSRKAKLKDEIDKISHKAKKDLKKVVDKSKRSVKHKSEPEPVDDIETPRAESRRFR
jgi:hypothetical protein